MDRSLRLGKLNRRSRVALGLAGCLALMAAILVASDGDHASASAGGLGLASQTQNSTTDNANGAKKIRAARGARFGKRILREGMVGPDVRILKTIVRSKRLLRGSPLSQTFDRPTTSAVRRFQRKADISRSGVVNRSTAKAMVRSLRTSEASWYGPGLYGNGTACGRVTLRPTTIGVANKNLPCGTRVLIGFRGRYVVAPVIDRGPYIAGRTWDLTTAAAKAIGLTRAGVGRVRHAIIRRGR